MSTPNMHTFKISRSFKVRLLLCPLIKPRHPTNQRPIADCFTRHGIDRIVHVEQLIKCKMQDNLEFLQWSKRYWDQHFPGGEYDAVARRRGSGAPPPASAPAPRTSAGAGAARRGTTPSGGAKVGGARAIGGGAGASAALQQENNTLKETVQGLERERDFYFSKLRDIELLIQQAVDEDPEIEKQEDGLIKHIQTILYSTEDGFEIPAEADGIDDQETF
jgi:RP/EB family microtubule-associated protein